MKKLALSLLFALTTLCATSSFAQTLISQVSGTTFPLIYTSSGSYKLMSNITVSTFGVNALEFNAPNVTLDLNGFTISGPMVCTTTSCNSTASSTGVYMYQNGSTVKNGFIKGFYYGASVTYGLAEYLNVSSNYIGIYANGSTVDHNSASSCYYSGIWANNGAVSDNSVLQNGLYALIAQYSSVVSNAITANNGYGLYIYNGIYANNTIFSNGTDVYAVGEAVSSKTNACTSGLC